MINYESALCSYECARVNLLEAIKANETPDFIERCEYELMCVKHRLINHPEFKDEDMKWYDDHFIN